MDRYYRLGHEKSLELEWIEQDVRAFAESLGGKGYYDVMNCFYDFIVALDKKIGSGIPESFFTEIVGMNMLEGLLEGLGPEEESRPKRKKGKRWGNWKNF